MNKIAFIDFDGTIVNVYLKYFHILNDYVTMLHQVNIDCNQYLTHKLHRVKDCQIVKRLTGIDLQVDDYYKYKHQNLELPKYLDYDKLIPNTENALSMLTLKGYTIEILSNRNSSESIEYQLNKLKIKNLIDRTTVLSSTSSVLSKKEYVKNAKISECDLVIGDSPTDMDAAIGNSLIGIFVKTGLFLESDVKNCKVFESLYEAVLSL